MALIRCDGCDAIHDSTTVVCPVCGRCPGCGKLRVSREELKAHERCPECGVPYCGGCGRCHVCNAVRFQKNPYPACRCGFPDDPERRKTAEKIFAIDAPRTGCGGLMLLVVPTAAIFALL